MFTVSFTECLIGKDLINRVRKSRHDCYNISKFLSQEDQKNKKRRREQHDDHNYQAAKIIDFDSASNTSNATTDDSSLYGPTTRRGWAEWVAARPKSPTSSIEQDNDEVSKLCLLKILYIDQG